jgi:predicted acylesterase/phospholipase RssA
MKSWKAWLLVAIIFITGAAAGAFAMRVYMARHLPELLRHTRQRLEEVFLENIDREVGLTAEQKEKILPILRGSVQRGDKIRESIRGDMDKLVQETDDRISEELNAEQRVKFAEFRERMAKLRREGGPHDPPPPGFPPGPPPGPPPDGGPRP